MSDLDPDSVMTVPELATYLKLAPSTIYRLAKARKLPGRKVGGAWRFSRQGIEGWLRERPSTIKIPANQSVGSVTSKQSGT